MEFLDVIETIKSEEASVQRLFAKEGTPVRSGRRAKDPAYLGRVKEAAVFVADVMNGRRPAHHLQEAMSTSDFPLLFGDILDRTVLAGYREAPSVWRQFVGTKRVRDFRPARQFRISGGEGPLGRVRELAEYPARALNEARFELSVVKYGARMPFSWETMINDDLDQLRDAPQRLGRGARRTENRRATELYVDANGPHASLYTTGNANIVNVANGASANNPALSISGLQDALLVLGRMRDDDGEPIVIEAAELVVPPALEITAQNILNATQLELTTDGGDANRRLHVANWVRNRLRLTVDPYIPILATTANGDRSWFLFAQVGQGPAAIQLGFLIGHEEPETFIKAPNAQRVGGGEINPLDGDFDNDSIDYKVRHVLGGSIVDPKSTVASNGSGA